MNIFLLFLTYPELRFSFTIKCQLYLHMCISVLSILWLLFPINQTPCIIHSMQHFNEQLYIIVLIKFYLTPLILPIKKKKTPWNINNQTDSLFMKIWFPSYHFRQTGRWWQQLWWSYRWREVRFWAGPGRSCWPLGTARSSPPPSCGRGRRTPYCDSHAPAHRQIIKIKFKNKKKFRMKINYIYAKINTFMPKNTYLYKKLSH